MQPPHSIGIPLPNINSAPAERDDAALVTASQTGDQEAFAILVQRHQRRVFNLVYRMLQQYEEANEVTQDTFLAAWQGLPSFRGDARFSTWLHRIAYNCALKQLEQRKRDTALQAAIQAETVDSDERIGAEIEAHDRQEVVREHISTLPAKYRIVLVLRHLQEMTYEEMAEILTMPVGTIKTHLFRARNLLKARLEAFDQEWKAKG
ncbi:RNA polymerase sigma factor [Dictyobacter alpinus]|uniref:RNA polymerase sigma factor n=1 Tax=Dictyobacter alpinus TaxID=2014873 RepID=A0A402B3D7_9CHLR|nr:sigma-70 family RNA polymerase sigma factor [Dictyobacter alpinus]GCE25864.1 RNA polymerase sigma factor [Dictyobacter alpinus]